jgi:hypothetical protein
MKDLGCYLYRENPQFRFKVLEYALSRVFIRQIIFQPVGEYLMLNCRIIFSGELFDAVLSISYEQFNDILQQCEDNEFRTGIAALLGEALSITDERKLQTTFQINLMKIFDRPLRLRGCTYYTRLKRLKLEDLADPQDDAFVFMVKRLDFQPALQ